MDLTDTGVDYKHPALGGCFGRGCKVAYGHDFVGDGYDNGDPENDTPKPDKDPMDCAGHGTHVAGIVAARNQGPNAKGSQEFVGVAPDVTLGAYRVFGCNGEVGDDVLLAALKAAYRDGMDVVNLSLGGPSGWPEEPFAMACSAYIRKGLHIAIANGNDGEEGLFEDGAPATASGAIAVGSVDNTHFLGPAADLFWQTIDQYGQGLSSKKVAVGRIGMAMGADAADAPLVTFKSNMTYVVQVPTSNSMGCKAYTDADLEHKNQVPRANIIILLRRGECTYNDKAKFVAEAKLGGMFVYDTAPEQRPLSMSVTGYNISAAGLSFEDASLILDALKLKDIQASSGLKLTAQISKTDQVLKLASGGKISDFSSWGPDARLRYKPDIVTPGGMIYSTFPLAKGGFSTLQGTSMASPYMAGIQALYLSKYGKTDPYRLLNILQSTAVPTIKSGSNTGLTSVFQQGGGLVSMERLFAAEPPTVVFPTALYLNDTQFQKLDHDLAFHNPSASTTRIWTMVHRPAVSVNGFEDTNHYIPVNQSRLRTLEHGADSVVMSPSQLRLGPGQTGTIHIRIEVPGSLNVQERWLYSGFLEFHCQTDKGTACDSSLVSYGGMHGHLASIPILNPAWTYPALQLDRYANAKDVKTQGLHINSAQETDTSISTKNNHGTKHKDLYRNRSERVMVGKDEQDWVQLLVSINFPTGLLTIEVESVCDDDHGRSNGGDGKIRLEIGGPGRSRFEIETAEELQEVEHVIPRVEQQGEQLDDMDPEEVALMKERLSRSQEMAFMPSGLYMPYEGYSKVMVQSSIVDEVMKLHRKKFHGAMDAEKTKHGHVGNKVGKPALGSKILKKNGGRRQGRGHCRKHGRRGRNKGHRRNTKKSPIPTRPSKSRTGATCVSRILGLIPNGFNPWSTRTGTAEGNTFQSYSWMGDLLLQNHNAHTTDQKSSFGSEMMRQNKKGGRHRKHRRKGTEQDKACKRQSQTTETRGLPNGRYRLVVKVLKPWGVRGRVSDIERWSSPIIVIKRGK
ncbi:hypothetical protein BGZ51_000411 [Haplosporangium sp. Z 767]|nr:hypothetical protein BGZ51_000411 [Haplosporangium sp. Z 767]